MKGKLILAVFAVIALILTVLSPLRDKLHYELNIGRVVTLEEVYETFPYELARLTEIKLKTECQNCAITYYPKTKKLVNRRDRLYKLADKLFSKIAAGKVRGCGRIFSSH